LYLDDSQLSCLRRIKMMLASGIFSATISTVLNSSASVSNVKRCFSVGYLESNFGKYLNRLLR